MALTYRDADLGLIMGNCKIIAGEDNLRCAVEIGEFVEFDRLTSSSSSRELLFRSSV